MQGHARAISTSLLVLSLVTVTSLPLAHAHQLWIGNDNGEFQESANPSWVQVEGWLSPKGLTFDPPPHGQISLQFNPDWYQSFCCQTFAEWFQAVIGSNSSNQHNYACANFAVQVWSTIYGTEGWNQGYPTDGSCVPIFNILNWDAGWYIREDVSYNHIIDVYFELLGFGGQPYSFTINVPHDWIWLRSNICWCGSSGDTVSFTTANGTLYYSSDQSVVKEDPPQKTSTAEDSNIGYGCFQNSGTTLMSQFYAVNDGYC